MAFQKESTMVGCFLCESIGKDQREKVTICLYNTNGKLIIDFHTGMENAWYVVKMAEQKGIQIQKVRDSLQEKMHL